MMHIHHITHFLIICNIQQLFFHLVLEKCNFNSKEKNATIKGRPPLNKSLLKHLIKI